MARSLLLALLLLPSLVLAQVPNIERAGGGTGVTDHGALTGLTDDDHTQYFLLAGRSGGQTAIGGTGSGDDLTLSSSSNGTKGSIFLGSAAVSAFDETTGTLNIGATSPTMAAGIYATSTLTDTGSVQNNTARFVASIDPTSSSAAQLRAMDVYANLADGGTTAVTGTVMGSRYLASNSRQTGLLSSMVGLQLQAINGIVFGAASGTATTDNITAGIFQAINNSASTTATATVTGGQFTGENRGTNTIGKVTAGQFTITNNNASATSTELRAAWLRTSTVFGNSVTAGTVTNGYMLDSEGWPSGPTYTNTPEQVHLQAGATAAIAIRQLGTSNTNRFQGKTTFGEDAAPTAQVEINGNADDEQLRIIGHSTQTSNILLVENSAGTDLFNVSNTGTATFAGDVTVPDEAYDATNWNGSLEVPTKNAVRDKIESLGGGGSHDLLSATHTDTVANAVSRGSLIYGNSTPAWDELTVGAAGTVLSSDGTDASWKPAHVTKIKSAAEGVTNSAALQDDDHLAGWTLSTGRFAIDCTLITNVSASATPDLKVAFDVVTSTVNHVNISQFFWGSGTGDFIQTADATAPGNIAHTSSGTNVVLLRGAIDVTNAGTLNLQWAQNTATAGHTTTLQRGSSCIVSKE